MTSHHREEGLGRPRNVTAHAGSRIDDALGHVRFEREKPHLGTRTARERIGNDRRTETRRGERERRGKRLALKNHPGGRARTALKLERDVVQVLSGLHADEGATVQPRERKARTPVGVPLGEPTVEHRVFRVHSKHEPLAKEGRELQVRGIRRFDENGKIGTSLARRALETDGVEYLEGLDIDEGSRVTWVSADGSILYDTEADPSEMENHAEREEIREALTAGWGESSRYSSTLTEQTIYYATRLADGSVLRISVSQASVISLLFGMLPAMAFMFAGAFVLSMLLGGRMSKRVVEPLTRLELVHPL